MAECLKQAQALDRLLTSSPPENFHQYTKIASIKLICWVHHEPNGLFQATWLSMAAANDLVCNLLTPKFPNIRELLSLPDSGMLNPKTQERMIVVQALEFYPQSIRTTTMAHLK